MSVCLCEEGGGEKQREKGGRERERGGGRGGGGEGERRRERGGRERGGGEEYCTNTVNVCLFTCPCTDTALTPNYCVP